ncbi:MAG TPA: hypothetical protein VK629_17715 [Steroidobacteraceae bacterium]|nr:hypothetical protein [Steroidobacteraceae bacterium]
MPFTFSIDKAAGVIREVWTGRVDLAQLEESCRLEWSHPDYDRQFKLMSDFRASEADISADDVLRFASWFSGEDPPPKHAIVIARESGLALGGVFAMICDTVTHEHSQATRLFFSISTAERWLQEGDPFKEVAA